MMAEKDRRSRLAKIKLELTRGFIPNTPEFSTDEAVEYLATVGETPEVLDVVAVLNGLKDSEMLARPSLSRKWIRISDVEDIRSAVVPDKYLDLMQMDIMYLDWQGHLPHLQRAFDAKEPPLLIGPAGSGKTQCIRKLAELVNKPLFTVNMSLRTREHHLIGRPDTDEDGNIVFKKGPLPISMEVGGILYIDEGNTCEPSMWLRFDEALDSRRQIRIEDEVVVAHPDWWVIMSVNPLGMGAAGGTRPLPPQIMNRFTVSFDFKYPADPDTEYKVIQRIVPGIGRHREAALWGIEAIQYLRSSEELLYHPSVRESRTVCRMLVEGYELRDAIQQAVINRYAIYGETTRRKAQELAFAKLG